MTGFRRETNHQRGLEAERHAETLLLRKGYEMLHRRFKVREGEIDLIARHGNLVAFIEVKTRSGRMAALESVTARNRQRIVNTSEIWAARYPDYENCDRRFDIILVLPGGRVEHLEDAFRPWD